MGGGLSKLFQSWYVKALIAAILLCAGVVGGVYIGDGFVRSKPIDSQQHETQPLALKLGDLFPLLTYQDEAKSVGTFEQLLKGKQSVLLFLRSGCPYCDNLLTYWNQEVVPLLDSSVNVIVCLQARTIPPSVAAMSGEKRLVFPEQEVYSQLGITVSPTIVGLDQYGFITYAHKGFSKELEKEFFERLAMKAK